MDHIVVTTHIFRQPATVKFIRVEEMQNFYQQCLIRHRQNQSSTATVKSITPNHVVCAINLSTNRILRMTGKVWDQLDSDQDIWLVTQQEWQEYCEKVLDQEQLYRHGKKVISRHPTSLSHDKLQHFISQFYDGNHPVDPMRKFTLPPPTVNTPLIMKSALLTARQASSLLNDHSATSPTNGRSHSPSKSSPLPSGPNDKALINAVKAALASSSKNTKRGELANSKLNGRSSKPLSQPALPSKPLVRTPHFAKSTAITPSRQTKNVAVNLLSDQKRMALKDKIHNSPIHELPPPPPFLLDENNLDENSLLPVDDDISPATHNDSPNSIGDDLHHAFASNKSGDDGGRLDQSVSIQQPGPYEVGCELSHSTEESLTSTNLRLKSHLSPSSSSSNFSFLPLDPNEYAGNSSDGEDDESDLRQYYIDLVGSINHGTFQPATDEVTFLAERMVEEWRTRSDFDFNMDLPVSLDVNYNSSYQPDSVVAKDTNHPIIRDQLQGESQKMDLAELVDSNVVSAPAGIMSFAEKVGEDDLKDAESLLPDGEEAFAVQQARIFERLNQELLDIIQQDLMKGSRESCPDNESFDGSTIQTFPDDYYSPSNSKRVDQSSMEDNPNVQSSSARLEHDRNQHGDFHSSGGYSPVSIPYDEQPSNESMHEDDDYEGDHDSRHSEFQGVDNDLLVLFKDSFDEIDSHADAPLDIEIANVESTAVARPHEEQQLSMIEHMAQLSDVSHPSSVHRIDVELGPDAITKVEVQEIFGQEIESLDNKKPSSEDGNDIVDVCSLSREKIDLPEAGHGSLQHEQFSKDLLDETSILDDEFISNETDHEEECGKLYTTPLTQSMDDEGVILNCGVVDSLAEIVHGEESNNDIQNNAALIFQESVPSPLVQIDLLQEVANSEVHCEDLDAYVEEDVPCDVHVACILHKGSDPTIDITENSESTAVSMDQSTVVSTDLSVVEDPMAIVAPTSGSFDNFTERPGLAVTEQIDHHLSEDVLIHKDAIERTNSSEDLRKQLVEKSLLLESIIKEKAALEARLEETRYLLQLFAGRNSIPQVLQSYPINDLYQVPPNSVSEYGASSSEQSGLILRQSPEQSIPIRQPTNISSPLRHHHHRHHSRRRALSEETMDSSEAERYYLPQRNAAPMRRRSSSGSRHNGTIGSNNNKSADPLEGQKSPNSARVAPIVPAIDLLPDDDSFTMSSSSQSNSSSSSIGRNVGKRHQRETVAGGEEEESSTSSAAVLLPSEELISNAGSTSQRRSAISRLLNDSSSEEDERDVGHEYLVTRIGPQRRDSEKSLDMSLQGVSDLITPKYNFISPSNYLPSSNDTEQHQESSADQETSMPFAIPSSLSHSINTPSITFDIDTETARYDELNINNDDTDDGSGFVDEGTKESCCSNSEASSVADTATLVEKEFEVDTPQKNSEYGTSSHQESPGGNSVSSSESNQLSIQKSSSLLKKIAALQKKRETEIVINTEVEDQLLDGVEHDDSHNGIDIELHAMKADQSMLHNDTSDNHLLKEGENDNRDKESMDMLPTMEADSETLVAVMHPNDVEGFYGAIDENLDFGQDNNHSCQEEKVPFEAVDELQTCVDNDCIDQLHRVIENCETIQDLPISREVNDFESELSSLVKENTLDLNRVDVLISGDILKDCIETNENIADQGRRDDLVEEPAVLLDIAHFDELPLATTEHYDSVAALLESPIPCSVTVLKKELVTSSSMIDGEKDLECLPGILDNLEYQLSSEATAALDHVLELENGTEDQSFVNQLCNQFGGENDPALFSSLQCNECSTRFGNDFTIHTEYSPQSDQLPAVSKEAVAEVQRCEDELIETTESTFLHASIIDDISVSTHASCAAQNCIEVLMSYDNLPKPANEEAVMGDASDTPILDVELIDENLLNGLQRDTKLLGVSSAEPIVTVVDINNLDAVFNTDAVCVSHTDEKNVVDMDNENPIEMGEEDAALYPVRRSDCPNGLGLLMDDDDDDDVPSSPVPPPPQDDSSVEIVQNNDTFDDIGENLAVSIDSAPSNEVRIEENVPKEVKEIVCGDFDTDSDFPSIIDTDKDNDLPPPPPPPNFSPVVEKMSDFITPVPDEKFEIDAPSQFYNDTSTITESGSPTNWKNPSNDIHSNLSVVLDEFPDVVHPILDAMEHASLDDISMMDNLMGETQNLNIEDESALDGYHSLCKYFKPFLIAAKFSENPAIRGYKARRALIDDISDDEILFWIIFQMYGTADGIMTKSIK